MAREFIRKTSRFGVRPIFFLLPTVKERIADICIKGTQKPETVSLTPRPGHWMAIARSR